MNFAKFLRTVFLYNTSSGCFRLLSRDKLSLFSKSINKQQSLLSSVNTKLHGVNKALALISTIRLHNCEKSHMTHGIILDKRGG